MGTSPSWAEVDGWSAITNYVATGVGISIVPDFCLGENDPLWKIPFRGTMPRRRYGVITRSDGLLSRGAGRLLRIMVPELEDGPGGP